MKTKCDKYYEKLYDLGQLTVIAKRARKFDEADKLTRKAMTLIKNSNKNGCSESYSEMYFVDGARSMIIT